MEDAKTEKATGASRGDAGIVAGFNDSVGTGSEGERNIGKPDMELGESRARPLPSFQTGNGTGDE